MAGADPEIEEMRRNLLEMEDEAWELGLLTQVNQRSIYVGNVDYAYSPKELQEHFESCGAINRITIDVDKWTGRSASVEFVDEQSAQLSLLLHESLLQGRQLKVVPKADGRSIYVGNADYAYSPKEIEEHFHS